MFSPPGKGIDIIATKTQVTEKTARALLKAYTEAVMEAMTEGLSVQLIGFGKFEVRHCHLRS